MSERQNAPHADSHSADAGWMLEMMRRMLLIRRVEESIAEGIVAGQVLCPCHLYVGQEAVAVGICSSLRIDDFVFSTHRSHGHYLAKGGDVQSLISEVFCKETGCSGGWGGSMHVADPQLGLPGSSAIVAGTIPLAVGAALAFASRGQDRVSVAFFGDGATNEGVFYESMNLAALWKLPVLFVCENNLYSTHMPVDMCIANTDIAQKGHLFGMPSEKVDGNDVVAVASAGRTAVERARCGGGPALIECLTYRWRGHVGPNHDVEKGLRSQEELDSWMRRCPVKTLEQRLLAQGFATPHAIQCLKDAVEAIVTEASARARADRFPAGKSLLSSPHRQGAL